jgi:hypothetical protein
MFCRGSQQLFGWYLRAGTPIIFLQQDFGKVNFERGFSGEALNRIAQRRFRPVAHPCGSLRLCKTAKNFSVIPVMLYRGK